MVLIPHFVSLCFDTSIKQDYNSMEVRQLDKVDKAQEIVCKLKEICKEKVLAPDFDQRNCWLLSPYDYEISRDSDDLMGNAVDLTKHGKELFNLLCDVLGHIIAEPLDQGNVEKLTTAYTFLSQSNDIVDAKSRDLNQSPEATETFLNRLAELAKNNSRLYKQYHDKLGKIRADLASARETVLADSRFAVFGDKGIGKTILFNYVLDVYFKKLLSEQVLLIRMDLAEEHVKINLKEWFKWQFCRVVLRQYHKQSHGLNLGAKNAKLIKRLAEHTELFRDRRLQEEFEIHRNKITSAQSPAEVPDWVYLGIYDYLTLDRDFGFIFILDGLDQLGLTKKDLSDYRAKMEYVRDNLFGPKADPGVYVAVMRKQSFELFGTDKCRPDQRYRVLDVPAIRIYENKIKCLLKQHLFHDVRFPNVHRLGEQGYQTCIEEVCTAFIKFVAYSLTTTFEGKSCDSKEDAFRILESIFGSDKRKIFESLLVVAEHFIHHLRPEKLQELLEGATDKVLQDEAPLKLEDVIVDVKNKSSELYTRYYMVVESLALLGENYFKARYEGAISFTGNRVHVVHKEHKPSPDILFNIFRYTYDKSAPSTLIPLAGIRILQLVRFRASMNRHEITEYLKKHLDYPCHIVRALFDEMLDGGVLRLCGDRERAKRGEVELAPLGTYTLMNLSKTLEYIALAVETTPLMQDWVLDGRFPIAAYRKTKDFVISNKVVSAVNFVRLLTDLESSEKKIYEDRGPSEDKGAEFDNFSFTEKIKDKVLLSVSRIIEQVYYKPQHFLQGDIEDRVMKRPSNFFGT